MNVRSWFSRSAPQLKESPKEETRTIIVQNEPMGVSGTEKFAGQYNEEYFRTLQGPRKANEYDKMRRGDARVKMCLSAVKNPIRSAQWDWMPTGELDETKKTHAEFLNFIFKTDLGIRSKKKFRDLLNEALTVADFGNAVFERTHKLGLSHPKWGQYIGLASLGWRSPKTITEWNTDKNGELSTVTQVAQGDNGKTVKMDARFLSIISLEKEGDNHEGISLLRPCYGAWSRKQLYLKMMAIGIEKTAIPTPKAKVPAGKENSPEYEMLITVLEKLTSHQMNYITYPEGWDIDSLTINFDADKVKSAVQFENEEMTFAFLANFLLLGAGGNGGAYALSSDLSDFFTKSILYIADLISEMLNEIGKELIILNFGEQETYPELTHQGITDSIGAEFGTLMQSLYNSRMITPDDNLEESIRKRMKLPAMRAEDKGRRDKAAAVPPTEPTEDDVPNPEPDPKDKPTKKNSQLTETQRARIQLAESKAQKKIGVAQDRVRDVIAKHLKVIGADLREQIMKNYKDLPEANKVDATNGVEAQGLGKFYSELKQEMVNIAAEAIQDARKEVPKAAKVKLAEFENLPKGVQKYLNLQSRLISRTTVADLEKVTFLQYGDSVLSTDSAALIEADMAGTSEEFIRGASVQSAGGNAASRIVNESRAAFFWDDEVLEQIESFTFVNGDPVSQICQDLAGRTFRKDDPDAWRMQPPLHHNCKSYVIVNLVGDKDNPPIDERGLKTKFTPGL